ncbi:hypothetical protein H5410_030935, partial [Solanum commersonii]
MGKLLTYSGVLNSHPALSMWPDKPRWKLHNKGVFTKKACLTHEALRKRGWQFCSRCVMCEQK